MLLPPVILIIVVFGYELGSDFVIIIKFERFRASSRISMNVSVRLITIVLLTLRCDAVKARRAEKKNIKKMIQIQLFN